MFLICMPHPLLLGQESLKQFPNPGPEEMDLFRGIARGDGTAQIEPCIIRHVVRLSSVKTKGLRLNLRAQLRIRLVRSECLMEGSQAVVCISVVRTPAWRAHRGYRIPSSF